MPSDHGPCDFLLNELGRRQLSNGGWSNGTECQQAALEPSCLAALALRNRADAWRRVRNFLLRTQNSDGSWPAFDGDDREGSWTTSLALITLYDCSFTACRRGFRWLLKFAGRESNYFWRWKFLTADRQVRFDPAKYGWPWFPDTVSWVVPTSFAILALSHLPISWGYLGAVADRVKLGTQMLIDRACPGGGWNAGNGIVYGTPLRPHVDDTAVTLLALRQRKQDPIVESGLLWLERTIPDVSSPWSVAWATLALAAYDKSVEAVLSWLGSAPDRCVFEHTGTLAMVCLAFDYSNTLSALRGKYEHYPS